MVRRLVYTIQDQTAAVNKLFILHSIKLNLKIIFWTIMSIILNS